MVVPKDPDRRKRRTRLILATVLALVVLLTTVQVLIYQLRFPTPIASNILIFALVNVNMVLLLILVLLVFRSLFKVYLERRDNLLGSKFRVKLVVAFVSLSLLPAFLLFVVASNLITNSVDSWFNIRVEESLQRSLDVAQLFDKVSGENIVMQARRIASTIDPGSLGNEEGQELARSVMAEKLHEYNLDAVQIIDWNGAELLGLRAKKRIPADMPPLGQALRRGRRGETFAFVQMISGGDLIRGVAPIALSDSKGRAMFLVATQYIPEGFSRSVSDVTRGVKEYQQLKMLKNPIKGIYIMLFLMVTLVIIFAAVWVGVYLARGITVPIQQLAEGTRAVASGNLNFKVDAKADDEFGILVSSFNKMTVDLRQSKSELESANVGLQRSNVELDQRRAYMETVLENIATGVLSLDQQGIVTTINPAAIQILGLEGRRRRRCHYIELLGGTSLAPLRSLLEQTTGETGGVVDQQLTLQCDGRVANIVVNISELTDRSGNHLGRVVVLEEITQRIRAEQTMAWREVARRIAHEIKNPLTPIKLSAQRLRKKFADRAPDYEQVFEECTRTIIQEVNGLKGLVDEFSRYAAKMPSSDPKPNDLHLVVEIVMTLYAAVPKGIKIGCDLDPELPLVNVDPEQMKRALINLVDNALDALEGEGEIVITTRYLKGREVVALEVDDTGPGIPQADRERLFLPYFSTKQGGTGLGLAIVHRIVAEHAGQIRIEDNVPKGTRIIIELPALVHSGGNGDGVGPWPTIRS
ncbi:MAG: HAMP domain-containing protein [candidate division NC10 bacterium]|nr:HAMP domain-containing protein [candidate division NC10 bacterium]